MILGIDCSHWQGTIDFAKAKASGRDFAIVEANGRSGDPDPMFTANRQQAHAAGLIVGLYYFARATDPLAESARFVATIGAVQPGEFLVLDWEAPTPAGGAPAWCRTWLDATRQATGVTPLIYMNLSTVSGSDWSTLASTYPLWLARYDAAPTVQTPVPYWGTPVLKQYSSTGSVPGVAGAVDLDAFYGTTDQLLALGGPMSATWIADALRAGGCTVDESIVPDWKSRGHTDGPTMTNVVGVMGHHTAGGATGNLPSLATVRDGRPDLAGPLANLMLSRAGVWVPIAAGRPWHAGAADRPSAWPWIPNGDANGCMLGIEAESAGTGDWTAAQLTAYPQGVAALLKYRGLPSSRFIAHKEWAPSRKQDPHGWPGDMTAFRASVDYHLTGEDIVNEQDKLDIADRVWHYVDARGPAWASDKIDGIDAKTGVLGPILTAVQDVQAKVSDLEGKVGQVSAPSLDEAKLAAALLSDPASVDRLGAAIAAHLKLASS